MSDFEVPEAIICSPFEMPDKHWHLEEGSAPAEPTTGRRMVILTTEPGIQFYTGNFLDGTLVGKGGKQYLKNFGFCLETQHYPDTPNKKEFPTRWLSVGTFY